MTSKATGKATGKAAENKPNTIEPSSQPTSHTDGVNIGCRDDGTVFLQFFSTIPGRLIENHRTMMSKAVSEKLIEVLCSTLEYYPVKPD